MGLYYAFVLTTFCLINSKANTNMVLISGIKSPKDNQPDSPISCNLRAAALKRRINGRLKAAIIEKDISVRIIGSSIIMPCCIEL